MNAATWQALEAQAGRSPQLRFDRVALPVAGVVEDEPVPRGTGSSSELEGGMEEPSTSVRAAAAAAVEPRRGRRGLRGVPGRPAVVVADGPAARAGLGRGVKVVDWALAQERRSVRRAE